ncbi:hypothetical protein NMY22_g19546 [Coprinellus aureogranulatus]|nr:hypothetical protein NMY22_g19546 [Coprinellus aureogranulatus]
MKACREDGSFTDTVNMSKHAEDPDVVKDAPSLKEPRTTCAVIFDFGSENGMSKPFIEKIAAVCAQTNALSKGKKAQNKHIQTNRYRSRAPSHHSWHRRYKERWLDSRIRSCAIAGRKCRCEWRRDEANNTGMHRRKEAGDAEPRKDSCPPITAKCQRIGRINTLGQYSQSSFGMDKGKATKVNGPRRVLWHPISTPAEMSEVLWGEKPRMGRNPPSFKEIILGADVNPDRCLRADGCHTAQRSHTQHGHSMLGRTDLPGWKDEGQKKGLMSDPSRELIGKRLVSSPPWTSTSRSHRHPCTPSQHSIRTRMYEARFLDVRGGLFSWLRDPFARTARIPAQDLDVWSDISSPPRCPSPFVWEAFMLSPIMRPFAYSILVFLSGVPDSIPGIPTYASMSPALVSHTSGNRVIVPQDEQVPAEG